MLRSSVILSEHRQAASEESPLSVRRAEMFGGSAQSDRCAQSGQCGGDRPPGGFFAKRCYALSLKMTGWIIKSSFQPHPGNPVDCFPFPFLKGEGSELIGSIVKTPGWGSPTKMLTRHPPERMIKDLPPFLLLQHIFIKIS